MHFTQLERHTWSTASLLTHTNTPCRHLCYHHHHHSSLPPPTTTAPPSQGFALLESELAEAYDYVSPCFPPHYNIFDSIFQMYHVQFAQVRGGQVGFFYLCLGWGKEVAVLVFVGGRWGGGGFELASLPTC